MEVLTPGKRGFAAAIEADAAAGGDGVAESEQGVWSWRRGFGTHLLSLFVRKGEGACPPLKKLAAPAATRLGWAGLEEIFFICLAHFQPHWAALHARAPGSQADRHFGFNV